MPSTTDADRRRMAEYLSRHGPTHGADLRVALGWSVARFWDATYGTAEGWFAIGVDGWWLSERGEQAVLAASGA